MRKSKKGRQHK